MNKIVFPASVVFISLFVTACSILRKPVTHQETRVSKISSAMEVPDGSLIYALPMTVFSIEVDFQRTIERPGPYARYASEMLGLRDVINTESESWIIKSIRVTDNEEIDPSEIYVIEASKTITSNALSLRKSGLVLDINPGIYRDPGISVAERESDSEQAEFRDLGADEYFISQSDTVYRRVKLDTAFIKIPYLVERKKPLNTEQLADRAAKALLELRDGKQFILTGEANVFPQDNAGIDEINRLEREYLALFAGKRLTSVKTIRYSFVPDREMAGKLVPLFYFSEARGPLHGDSQGGDPVLVELVPSVKVKDITVINKPATGENVQNQYDRLYYRIPDVVTVRIRNEPEVIYESRKLIYQFGQVVQLPSNYIIGK